MLQTNEAFQTNTGRNNTMYNRPLFNHNHTTEEKIVGTTGLLIIYGFLIYVTICQIIKTSEKIQKEKIAKHNVVQIVKENLIIER